MDHHVPSAVTKGLRRRGIKVITAFEDGTADLADELLLGRATEQGCVLFSQDDDLLILTRRWLQANRTFAGLIYARQTGITIGQAIHDLELIAQVFNPEDMKDRIEFLPL